MLTITVDDGAFRAYMQRLQKSLGNMEPVMDAIGARLESNIRNRFATATDPSGKRWAVWKDSTKDSYPRPGAKSKHGAGNHRLLDRYGTMLDSLNYQPGPSSVRIGFGQPYATYHEFGTKHMDRRGMLMADPTAGILAPDDERTVLDVLETFLGQLSG